ncbi:MAG: hypothetical protein IPP15_23210 [Saprospiraceae bacterium]|uniref:Uncharacterized protein n=1 Tax=Candidatus Opimibacter skivensis TaxID=2982028 RepID=A0A9D7T066_9BACT|nr:hypothetical protein [Candidatus Opimibacter skivensis]
MPWTNGIETGIINLIEKENLHKPIILAHFVTGTQVALNLAHDWSGSEQFSDHHWRFTISLSSIPIERWLMV